MYPTLANGDFYTKGVTAPAVDVLLRVTVGKAVVSGVKFDIEPVPGVTVRALVNEVQPADASVTYVWRRDGVVIPGVTGPTYTVLATDAGQYIGVTVTAVSPADGSTANSGISTIVPLGKATVASVSVSGTPVIGATLTANVGAVTPAGGAVTYEWFDGVDRVAGPSASNTYVVQAEDAGKALWVRAKASATNYTPGFAQSSPLATVPYLGQVSIGSVTITGTMQLGEVIYAEISGLSPADATLVYEWYRGPRLVQSTLWSTPTPANMRTVAAADESWPITVKVTASKAGYQTVTATSAAVTYARSGIGGVMLHPEGGSLAGWQLKYYWGPDATHCYGLSQGTAGWFTLDASGEFLVGDRADGCYQIWLYDPAGQMQGMSRYGSGAAYAFASGTRGLTIYLHCGSLNVESLGVTGVPVVGSTLRVTDLVVTPQASALTITYQWRRDDSPISTARSDSYVVQAADLGHQLSVSVTVEAPGYDMGWKQSDPILVTTGGVAGVITQTEGLSLAGWQVRYIWGPDAAHCFDLSQGTASWYTLDASGEFLVGDRTDGCYQIALYHPSGVMQTLYRVGGMGGAFGFTSGTRGISLTTNRPALQMTSVSVTGTPAVGMTLSTDSALAYYVAGHEFAYQWLRNGVVITGATSRTYVVQAADVGQQLSVRATVSAPGWAPDTATSAPVTVTAASVVTLGSVAVSGTAVAGGRLQATLTGLSPADAIVTYQWFRGTSTIPGATQAAYTLTAADAGRDIVLKVTAAKTGLTAVTKYSNHVQVFGVTRVEVTGVAAPGNTLQLAVDYLPAAAGLVFQWYRGTSAIAGATQAAYKLTAADAGGDISVKVTAALPGFTSITKYSNHVLVLGASKVVLSGSAAVGSQLVLDLVTAPADATVVVAWYRGTSVIAGVTGTRYTLTAADAGGDISVKVTVSKAGASVVKYSNHLLVPAGLSMTQPSILASRPLDVELTVSLSVTPANATVGYQWFADGVAIPGATYVSYTPMLGQYDIVCKVTATAPGLGSVTKYSNHSFPNTVH
jgi:hypothetical protein